MSIISEVLKSLLSETEDAAGASRPKAVTLSTSSYPRARGTSRLQKAPPPAPTPYALSLAEEPPLASLPESSATETRRTRPLTFNVKEVQQGVLWAEILGKPRAMRPWSPRS
ncbi:MAG: hypothetical protein KGZ92_08015 [Firmicutes bacterium]|nr:hypothetical protein [Dethiobacter sp.]MBS3889212.1 hypothetical protein [Bacillota bacterium]MBS4054732.1 hypothetical protein [Thermaerobacter sp.]